MVNGKYWPILVGTAIQSLSESMIFQSCNLFINKWFPATEYGTASTIGTSSSVFMAVGFIISGIVFADPEVDVKTALNKLFFY